MSALPIVGLTLLLGKYLSKQEREPIRKSDATSVDETQKPNGPNIYSSNRLQSANELLLAELTKNYKDAETPEETGIIPPHFNTLNFVGTKGDIDVMGLSSSSGSKLEEINKIQNIMKKEPISIEKRPMFQEYIIDQGQEEPGLSQLTGEPIIEQHSNMVPFFGSNVKQNTEQFTNDTMLSKHTGVSELFKTKKEVEQFFPLRPQDINGTPILTNNVIVPERYISSRTRENEKPFPEQQIAAPIAGTYQNAIRPVYKDVNELRVESNPKESYKGRIVAGKYGSVRGALPTIEKNRPDTFREQGNSSYWFRGPGAQIAQKVDEDYSNLQGTNRQNSNIEYYGPSFSTDLEKSSEYPSLNPSNLLQAKAKESLRQNFANDPIRNVGGYQFARDYGKNSFDIPETERDTPNDRSFHVHRSEGGIRIRNDDQAKSTHRESTSANKLGNIKTTFDKNTTDIYNEGVTSLEIRDTIKEQLVENKYKPQPNKNTGMGYIVTKYEAKDTFKEETLVRDRASGPQKFQIAGGKGTKGDLKLTDKMVLKESQNKRPTVKTNFPGVISSKSEIGQVGRLRNEQEDKRLVPSLVKSQLQDNPYALKPHFY
jgi:hypothetical protein